MSHWSCICLSPIIPKLTYVCTDPFTYSFIHICIQEILAKQLLSARYWGFGREQDRVLLLNLTFQHGRQSLNDLLKFCWCCIGNNNFLQVHKIFLILNNFQLVKKRMKSLWSRNLGKTHRKGKSNIGAQTQCLWNTENEEQNKWSWKCSESSSSLFPHGFWIYECPTALHLPTALGMKSGM